MPLVCYVPKTFRSKTLDVIDRANEILDDYAAQGFDLTLRQLYYQFVSRALIPNRDAEYDKLGSIVNDARLAGLIDWDRIVDRTRELRGVSHWESPAQIIRGAADGFRIDKQREQPTRVEVWIEKDALVGVIDRVCRNLDVDFFSCRGYVSQSEMWSASQRIGGYLAAGQAVSILHLGDHDPSGIDMTRDIRERLTTFLAVDYANEENLGYHYEDDEVAAQVAVDWVEAGFEVERIALNMAQVEQYDPPPNPAKITDSRATGYIAEHGNYSWELDALEPTVIADLIAEHVGYLRDDALWRDAVAHENRQRASLSGAADRWSEVAEYLDGDSA